VEDSIPPGDPRVNPTPPKIGAVGVAVIAFVGVDLGGSTAPTTRGCTHRWDVIDHGRQHGHVRDVGGGDDRGQRQAAAVAD
jgi:hypothetical protein